MIRAATGPRNPVTRLTNIVRWARMDQVLSSWALIVGRLPTGPGFSLFACTIAPFHFVYYHDCAAPERAWHDQNWYSCWSKLINVSICRRVGSSETHQSRKPPELLVQHVCVLAAHELHTCPAGFGQIQHSVDQLALPRPAPAVGAALRADVGKPAEVAPPDLLSGEPGHQQEVDPSLLEGSEGLVQAAHTMLARLYEQTLLAPVLCLLLGCRDPLHDLPLRGSQRQRHGGGNQVRDLPG